ncbi:MULTISPECIES: acetyltransferase [Kordiimonas]|jgi:sugar O-acyltransferase (sialic acid O-acetyltransferase NeuD family)|uniref:acetyltransferase n=1 Tax=Kordiimonas TaxID=288021 RepID=UPI00257E880B|nr:acetyltransferase [Kordiimonas sp. UBA4487]
MTRLILIGGGGHCKAAIDVIEKEGCYSIAGIIERPATDYDNVLGYPVIGTDDDLAGLVSAHSFAFVTIGQIKSPEPRCRAFERVARAGAILPVIVSPNAYVSHHSSLGEGTLVMHGAIVNAAATVGLNCILNSQSLVEHDAKIGNHCHIATGARVNGDVIVEEGCFIGSGAILKNGVTIGAGSIIGAGCVIRNDIPPSSLIRQTTERAVQ